MYKIGLSSQHLGLPVYRYIANEAAICHKLPIHDFTGGRKKNLDRSLRDQHFSILCFSESIRTNCFLVDTIFGQKVCF